MKTRLTFLGATGTVTGSRFLLEIEGQKLLVDCGLFQGRKEDRERNWVSFPVAPPEVNRVFLTHAHIDHAGYLPRLCKQGFTGPIHCTYPTADLCRILLLDSAHLQEEDAHWANKKGFSKHKPALPLFTTYDAERSLKLIEPVYYGEQLDITPNIRVKFKDAGHLLGSSFVDVRVTNGRRRRKIVFGGDLGRPARDLLRDPVQVYDIDYLILESTYGDRLHEDISIYDEMARIVNDSVDRGGVLVIPSFAVGRTQTLLFVLRDLEEQGKIPSLPIFVDSPMAVDATEIYEKRISDQNLSSRTLTIKGKRVFRPLQLCLCDSRERSREINERKNKAIIISSSGMATGGRILHHLQNRLPYLENTVLFVGYQAHGTRGRTIIDGREEVKIYGRNVSIQAKIENLPAFSGHADYHETLAWLMGFNRPPERTFIIHGESQASASLADKIRSQFGWDVAVPQFKDSFELDL